MVLRKPTPQEALVPAPLSQAANDPPYPTTPSEERPSFIPSASERDTVYSPDLHQSPAFDLKTVQDAQKKKDDNDNESEYSLSDWDKSDDEDSGPEDLPGPLKIGGGKPVPQPANKSNALPDALRVGPPSGVPVKLKSTEFVSPEPTGATASSYGASSNASEGSIPLQTNNPYLKIQMTGQSNFGAESSQQIWGDDRENSQATAPQSTAQGYAQNYGELVELPSFHTPDTPTHGMANLNLNGNASQQDVTKNEEQPPLIAVELPTPQSAHPRQDSSTSEAWNPGADISSLDAFARGYGLSGEDTEQTNHQTWQEQQAWEQNERERKQRELHAAREAAERAEQERRHEEEFHRGEQQANAMYTAQSTPPYEEPAPALPPRRSQEEHPPAMPPRPLETGIVGSSTTPGPESPNTAMNRQRKEHYQIKHIRWHDVNKSGTRSSPILTQNVNGPCPLLALVNALVLSTPPGIETALVETLRTREQVSLGLLLDAVFDELMSGRRGEAAQELPDVGELYKFLLALHTGLNINPMFVPDSDATDGTAVFNSSQARQPGGFENTRDMKLYRTFNIPLMHGWLPERGSDAYQAFERIAKSYETSQYVQFQEEELDAKLQTGEPLTTDEQQMFTDIHAIKEFLNRWPTQLTDYGLKTMRETLQPGQVAILFRNDHFSTLYKDPRTDRLVTLVTDQGYSSHDEIVWESLVDANGQGSELFSGDFRPVGNHSTPQRPQNQQPVQSMLDIDDNQGWTTVQSRRGQNQQPSPSSANAASPTSEFSRTEQEDHDLALALQLQEEEDDRHRRSVEERRRREDQLSENAISAQASQRPSNNRISRPGETPPVIPPRRNNVQTHRPNNEPAPPPTYEEAATNPPYVPPQGHPANPAAPMPQPGSAYRMNSNQILSGPGGRRPSGQPIRVQNMQGMPGRPGRRHSAGVVGPNPHEERDKCTVM